MYCECNYRDIDNNVRFLCSFNFCMFMEIR